MGGGGGGAAWTRVKNQNVKGTIVRYSPLPQRGVSELISAPVPTSVCGSHVAWFKSARFVLSLIRIACFRVDSSVCFDVPERVIHKPSLAAIVTIASRAVNEILFAERDEFSCFLEVLPFQ